jgi:hypothetical protein
MNGDHARTQSKHRATANVARSRSTLSGVWPDFGRCPDIGRQSDIAMQGRRYLLVPARGCVDGLPCDLCGSSLWWFEKLTP